MDKSNDRLPALVKDEAKKFGEEGNVDYPKPPIFQEADEVTSPPDIRTFRIVEKTSWSVMRNAPETNFLVEEQNGGLWLCRDIGNTYEDAVERRDRYAAFQPTERVIETKEFRR